MEKRDHLDVTDNPQLRRFEAHLDGRLAGFAAYERVDGRVVFTHTEVDDAFAGRGVGGALADGALAAVRAEGAKAVPLCPFVSSYIDRHPELADLVDREMLDQIRP